MEKNYWQAYLDMKSEHHFYPRDAAKKMDISELELLLTHPKCVYLGDNMRSIVLRLKDLGEVECIVRNDYAVHEKSGIYENVSMTKTTGIALNVGELDLRISAGKWKHAISLDDTDNGGSRSIQFYDGYGEAIQKVFVRDETKVEAWEALTKEFANPDHPTITEKAPVKTLTSHKLNDTERTEFHQRWKELKDIHHFGGILETYNLNRISAYEQAPEDMAYRVHQNAFEQAFESARDSGIEVMIFVGNRGIVQIQTGEIHHVKRMHGWLNILDKKEERFCLHLKDTDLAQIWAVRRPTRDSLITCIEGFDSTGETVLIMFGRREEGDPEQTAWQKIVQDVIDSSKG